jgi:hypothetical protein
LAIEHAATVQQGETGDCQWNDSYSRCGSHLTVAGDFKLALE